MIRTRHVRPHFRVNRILLLMLGLWPYGQSKPIVRFQFVLLFGILTTFILSQLGVFITSRCTADLVLKILFTTFVLITSVIKYISFYVNSKEVKSLIEQIQCIYDELRDEKETAILSEYGDRAKRYTSALTMLSICVLSVLFLSQLWPRILDIFLPANNSRPIHTLRFINEYFLDQEKHVYLPLLHANAAICISGLTMLSTGTMLMSYGQHICGMFRIASYRIQHAMKPVGSRSINTQNEKFTYERIIYAVDIHRKTLQFAEFLMSTFTLWFFLLIGAGVISTSLNLLRIFLTLSSGYDIEELTLQVILLSAQYLYMFIGNYVAQKITDHNNHVFITVYNIQWYMAPLQIQKMVLFMLQKGTRTYNLQIGGIFVGSLEGFATLISATISYFTVIYSTRQ